MSEMFKGYERDFSKHLASANKRISSFSGTAPSEGLINEAKDDLQQAERCLKLMENELTSLPPQLASQYQPRIKRHQDNIKALKQSLNQEQLAQNRTALVGQAGKTSDKREQLLGANETLQNSGETLERALKLGLETEALGNDTMNDLYRQRKQIQNINEKVRYM
jgi:vesicle transport through interaction with t-SNAREs protein 1